MDRRRRAGLADTARELLALVAWPPRACRAASASPMVKSCATLPSSSRASASIGTRAVERMTASTASTALLVGVDVVERDRAVADAAQPGGRREAHAGGLQPLHDVALLAVVDQARRQRREAGGDVNAPRLRRSRASRRCRCWRVALRRRAGRPCPKDARRRAGCPRADRRTGGHIPECRHRA